MYCSSCGVTIAPGLTFCKQCGSRLNLAKPEQLANTREINPEALLWAIVGVFLGGLGVIIGLMAVMQNVLHFHLGLIIFFSLLSFLMMTLIEAVFIWRFVGKRKSLDQKEPAQLPDFQARALPEPFHSVTEQTTRSFEPVLRKQSESRPLD